MGYDDLGSRIGLRLSPSRLPGLQQAVAPGESIRQGRREVIVSLIRRSTREFFLEISCHDFDLQELTL